MIPYFALFFGLWIVFFIVLFLVMGVSDKMKEKEPSYSVNFLGSLLLGFLPALAFTLIVYGLKSIF